MELDLSVPRKAGQTFFVPHCALHNIDVTISRRGKRRDRRIPIAGDPRG
jgi:hypothetical protein